MLMEIPEGIGKIPTLELIEVKYTNESVVKSAKQIKEDQESYGNYGLHVFVIPFLWGQSFGLSWIMYMYAY